MRTYTKEEVEIIVADFARTYDTYQMNIEDLPIKEAVEETKEYIDWDIIKTVNNESND